MKFNDEELKAFKRDLEASLKGLSEKYKIDFQIGKISVVDEMFSLRLTAEHKLIKPTKKIVPSKPVIKPAPKPEAKPAPAAKPKKKLDDISDEDLEDLDLDNLDLDDMLEEEPKKAVKPAPKPAPKPEAKPAPAAKPKKKLDDISDEDLEDLDLDNLDLDDMLEEEPKKAVKPALAPEKKTTISKLPREEEEPKKKKRLEDLTDEELANMDFSDIDFGDEEEEEVVKPKKKRSSYEDDDSRFDQELERFINPGKKVEHYDPRNVFEENDGNHTYDEDISDDEIDAYLAASGILDYSFQAKLIQADGLIQDYYTDMKNLLLSNDGVKSKVMWDFDAFTYQGKTIARIAINDDALEVYLALDPVDYEGSTYEIKKVTDPKYAGTKVLAVIKDMRDEDQLYDLIGDLAEAHDIMPGEDRYDDYHFQYETNDELIARGLIKQN